MCLCSSAAMLPFPFWFVLATAEDALGSSGQPQHSHGPCGTPAQPSTSKTWLKKAKKHKGKAFICILGSVPMQEPQLRGQPRTQPRGWDYGSISRNQRAKPHRLCMGPGYLIPSGTLKFAGKNHPVYTGGGVLKDWLCLLWNEFPLKLHLLHSMAPINQ